MRLRTRLLLVGAVIPLVLLVGAMLAAGLVFDRVILEEHDHSLMGQAGVEAVSLFDRASAPHLHLLESPLDNEVRDFTPRGALYGPDGELITQYPVDAEVPTRIDPSTLTSQPQLETVHGELGRDRQLRVRVDDPAGEPYALWLAASLHRHDREIESYWQISALVLLVTGSMLLAVQIWHANALSGRIGNLSRHMAKLRAGALDDAPPLDGRPDEIGELREAIAEATSRLAAAQVSQDRLIADAAHELRTPLAALRAEIDVALHRERDAEELRDRLEHARVEVDRLGTLSSHLLDLAALRASPLRREQGNLVSVLVEALDAARALAETKGCVVQLNAPDTAPAEFSAAAIRQALDNLLSNAIKFSPARSEIEVELRRDGERWCFEVRDRGPGVPVECHECIFEPFFTRRVGDGGTEDQTGAGLGLSVVHDVALRHGGAVRVAERDEGPGAVFRMWIAA